MVDKVGCVIAYTPGHNNYGTSLQGYAMLKKIQHRAFSISDVGEPMSDLDFPISDVRFPESDIDFRLLYPIIFHDKHHNIHSK